MSRATLATVQRMVYGNLAIDPSAYGTLDTSNKRYTSGQINDAIASADIRVVNLLLKYKQELLLVELYDTIAVEDGDLVGENWAVISVSKAGISAQGALRYKEITWDKMTILREGGIFDIATYDVYYCIKDGIFYTLSPDELNLTFINLTHPTTLSALKSPTGFESIVADFATARLLMKRMDKPQESNFYTQSAYQSLQEYGIPQTAMEEMVDNK